MTRAERQKIRALNVAIWNDRRDLRHGTANGYCNWYCRCDKCLAAFMRKKKVREVGGLSASSSMHGTVNGYSGRGCRCDACRAAATAARRDSRRRARAAS